MMKKVTMLVFILTLCITGIASAVEIPACVQICYPSAEAGDTVTMTLFDEFGEQINMNEYNVVEINFEGSGDPSGFAWPFDDTFDLVMTEEGTLQYTMVEQFYFHNRWTIGVEGEGTDGFWNTWIAIPEGFDDPETGCDDCGEPWPNLNWPPGVYSVIEAIENGGIYEECACTPPVYTIIVDSGEVAEEGETSADLTIQLDRNPTAPVTITIAEPVWETDPNLSDPESFTIAGAVDGVATVIIPADSNSTSITVTAIDDSVIEGNLGYGLVVESYMGEPNDAGYDPNLVTGDAAILSAGSVTVIDNDVRTVLVDPDFVALSENTPDDWVCVDVTLSHEPLAVVNVGVDLFEWAFDQEMVETDADLDDPNALQFDATNWDIPQQICFSSIDNDWLTEPWVPFIPAVCELIPASEDPGYDLETGLDPQAVINIEVEDNECGSYGWDDRDYNEDCFVNLEDFAEFARGWMLCTDPGNPACAEE